MSEPCRAQAQVGAHLDGPGEERPGTGPSDQGQHLGHVRRVEEAEIGVAGGLEPGPVHLHAGYRRR